LRIRRIMPSLLCISQLISCLGLGTRTSSNCSGCRVNNRYVHESRLPSLCTLNDAVWLRSRFR
jgi:hypothetical protein